MTSRDHMKLAKDALCRGLHEAVAHVTLVVLHGVHVALARVFYIAQAAERRGYLGHRPKQAVLRACSWVVSAKDKVTVGKT